MICGQRWRAPRSMQHGPDVWVTVRCSLPLGHRGPCRTLSGTVKPSTKGAKP